MHIQIVNFGLNGISDKDYQLACQDETEPFATMPGLLAKIWLRNADSNIYGGLYFWRDRESYENYINGEIFNSIKSAPEFSDVTSLDFEIIEALTKATQPGLTVVGTPIPGASPEPV